VSDRRPSRGRTAGALKQLLRALLVAGVSVGMLLGSFMLSKLEAPDEAQPSSRQITSEPTITPFLPTFTPQPSPTLVATEPEPTRAPTEEPEPTRTTTEEAEASPTPEPTSSPTPVPTRTPAPTQTPHPVASCTTPSDWTRYTVRRGDTLVGLARQSDVSEETLKRGNCLTTSALRTGQSIYVPPSFTAVPLPVPTICGAPADWVSYRVQSGDTLFSLARHYDVDIETLQRANCLRSHAISAGDTLYVPTGMAVSTAPLLLSPEDGANFPAGQRAVVRWTWEGDLGEHEHFDVRLWKEGAPHHGIGWSKEAHYAVHGDPGVTYYWSVAVIYGKDGKMLEQLSPETPPREISWGDPE